MREPLLIARARGYGDRPAILEGGVVYGYDALLRVSESVASALLDGRHDLEEARVAFAAPAGFDYVVMQWGIWRAGGVAVPLSVHATVRELEHVLGDSGAELLVVSGDVERWRGLGYPVMEVEVAKGFLPVGLPEICPRRRAMILYTSGTTSRPKGVVTTHANLEAQVGALVEAWEWSGEDRIPLFLPLHHIHGIVNVLGCALWSGALVEAFPKFEAEVILPRVREGAYSLFMAVPTIYAKLSVLLERDVEEGGGVAEAFGGLRLMVSGSAALPAGLHRRWSELTGQCLLERYGMTETGMILSNPLHGERRPGAVGMPVPGVEVRLRAEGGGVVGRDEAGEIQVRGPGVFLEYWGLPEVTEESFEDGWFRTGDMGVMERGYYRILGRLSVDIIKSGGYKLSALEIEAALLDHPLIRECAVVGVEDEVWGETVAVAVVAEEGGLDLEGLRSWAKDRLSAYKLPKKLKLVGELPRNAMGKVSKREVAVMMAE